MRILEEFWYGNIEPTEYDTIACKEYKEVLRLITRNEEKLERIVFPVHGYCSRTSDHGRVSAVPKQF